MKMVMIVMMKMVMINESGESFDPKTRTEVGPRSRSSRSDALSPIASIEVLDLAAAPSRPGGTVEGARAR
jgi:hypothetical protein